ncbi:hypothetical protein ACIQWR_38870 [Streptomyces sp. NPDC098789]|uniref:hypothetical protein n=1 Tax=Streptomyces sp. NPDC098789 TaxID=3366098 RepID=UPI0037FCF2B2
MVRDWVWHPWGAAGFTAFITTVVGVAHYRGTATVVFVLMCALVAGGLYAGLGLTAMGELGFIHLWRQQMTWEMYRDRAWEPHEADMEAQVEQMRKVEARVAAFVAAHDMHRITLAVTGARIGWAGDANSARTSKTLGHIELGLIWFFPEGQPALAYIVEHELAHIQRNDSVHQLFLTSGVAVSTVACTGLLPFPYAAMTIALLFAARSAVGWWKELACDTIAARQCGRPATVRALTLHLDERRAKPKRLRYLSAVRGLRSHPPLLLRHWWIRHAPALPATDAAAPTALWNIGR